MADQKPQNHKNSFLLQFLILNHNKNLNNCRNLNWIRRLRSILFHSLSHYSNHLRLSNLKFTLKATSPNKRIDKRINQNILYNHLFHLSTRNKMLSMMKGLVCFLCQLKTSTFRSKLDDLKLNISYSSF